MSEKSKSVCYFHRKKYVTIHTKTVTKHACIYNGRGLYDFNPSVGQSTCIKLTSNLFREQQNKLSKICCQFSCDHA